MVYKRQMEHLQSENTTQTVCHFSTEIQHFVISQNKTTVKGGKSTIKRQLYANQHSAISILIIKIPLSV